MGIYIKGLEMPKENEGIQLWLRNDGTVECVKSIFPKGDEPVATLIEMEQTKATYIPEPHGRLIDADVLVGELESDIAFINEQLKEYRLKPHNFVDDFDKKIKVVKNKLLDEISIIEAAPTVIEGSEE